MVQPMQGDNPVAVFLGIITRPLGTLFCGDVLKRNPTQSKCVSCRLCPKSSLSDNWPRTL